VADHVIRFTRVGLGGNNFGRRVDLDGTRAVLDAALAAGVCFVDTAELYGSEPGESEALVGRALAGGREDVTVATKFGYGRAPEGAPAAAPGSREYVRWAVEGSLRRLRTDVIDLYQYHRPDGTTPIAETLGAMSELVDEGKVRALGVSQHSAAQIREAHEAAGDRLVAVQEEYNLLERDVEAEILPECRRLGLGLLPFFPLASGLLTGKYRRGEEAPAGTRLRGRGQVADDATFDKLERMARFAEERGIESIDVAIGWLAAQDRVASVIAGATRPEQVERNARAAEWKPSARDLAELDGIFQPGG
jgi:aryl-alcohol dehydrogenase-like predicted oxidoreductase